MGRGSQESGVTDVLHGTRGIDTGDVIAVERLSRSTTATTPADVPAQGLTDATLNLLRTHLDANPPDGTAPRHPAGPDDGSTNTRRRRPGRREIDWSRPAQEIVELWSGALAPPYPLAHTFGGDGVPDRRRAGSGGPGAGCSAPAASRLQGPLRQRVLCVVAHPDDETLASAETLALHAAASTR
jgi:hypothetical protein